MRIFFVTCVLNPRIEYEELACWRRSLAEALAESAVRYRKDPCLIWNEVCGSIRQPVNDAYDILRMCPLSVYKSGRGSRTDQKNLFVAAARSLGIPARRNPETGNAEFYQKGAFHPADRKVEEEKGGRLTLLAGGEKSWTYWTDWCLEYWEEDGYSALNLEKENGRRGAFLYRKAGLLQGYYGGPAAKRESIGKGITFPDGKRGQDHPLRAA